MKSIFSEKVLPLFSFSQKLPSNSTIVRTRLYTERSEVCDCFHFNTKEIRKRVKSVKVDSLQTELAIDFGNSSKFKSIYPVAYITSKANVFRATYSYPIRYLWHDGKVEEIEIGRNSKYLTTFSDVHETIWAGSCSKQSYHEILAERYFKKDFSSSNITTYKKNNAYHRIPCPNTYECVGITVSFNYPTCIKKELQTWEEFKELLRCSESALYVRPEHFERITLPPLNF